MDARSISHKDTEYKDSKFQVPDNNTIGQAHGGPDQASIKDALVKIRPQGLQNLVAIPADGGPLTGRTFELPSQLDAAADWALSKNQAGKNLYFTVNPVNARVSKKPTKDDIAGAEYAHIDIDPDVSDGYEEGRRRLWEETLPALKGFEPPPALVIDSGNGLGVFWRLDSAEIAVAEDINQRLIERFGGDAGTWNVDRLMRLPGTLNYPSSKKLAKGYPAAPSLAELLVNNSGACSVSSLGNVLPEPVSADKTVPEVPSGAKVSARGELRSLTEREQQQLELRLKVALEQNPKLRERWDGSTAQLADPTRSGMDFSVTAMLKARGFTFTETAHLLTHCFEHGKGAENNERDLRRCWDRSGTTQPSTGVRGWINGLYTTEQAAQEAGLDVAEVAGLDPYSVLIRGMEDQDAQDHNSLVAQLVRRGHERALGQMNNSFAKTMIGGKVAVIREFTDPSFGTPTYAVMHPPQLKEWYRGIEAYKAVDGEAKRTNLGQDWLDWLGQRRYGAMTFMPGQVGPDIYNAWAGFPIPPVEGDWSLMKQLMLEGLCDGNEAYYAWLMDWMAIGLQDPTSRYGVAVVLRGEKGVGKGQFAKWFGKLFGIHYLHLANAQHLVGNFNAHLERALLVFADELIWGGNKQQEGVLKALVTEEMIPIERKGWDTEMRKNYTRLLVASNEDWAVPAGVGERRWFILDVSSKFRRDTDFFAALKEQMEAGGLEAMMQELMNRKIQTNQREAPRTKALAAVATLGLDEVAAWLHEALSVGELRSSSTVPNSGMFGSSWTTEELEAMKKEPDASTRMALLTQGGESNTQWPYAIKKDALYDNFAQHAKTHNRYGRVRDRASFFKRLGNLLPSANEQRPRLKGKPERIYLLPPLEEARSEFIRTSGLDFEFDFEEAA